MTTRGLAIPYAVSLEGLLEIVSSWSRIRDLDRPVSKVELAKVCKLRADTIRKQNPFLEQVGFVVKEGQKLRLSKGGIRLAQVANKAQTSELEKLFREVVLEWKELRPIIDYIAGRQSMSRVDLSERIILHSGRSRDNKETKMGAATLIDLLIMVGLLEATDDQLKISSSFIPGRTEQEYPDSRTHISTSLALSKSEDGMSVQAVVTVSIDKNATETRLNSFAKQLLDALRQLGFSQQTP